MMTKIKQYKTFTLSEVLDAVDLAFEAGMDFDKSIIQRQETYNDIRQNMKMWNDLQLKKLGNENSI